VGFIALGGTAAQKGTGVVMVINLKEAVE